MRDLRHYVLIGLFGIWKHFFLLGLFCPASHKCNHGLQRGSCWEGTTDSGRSVNAFVAECFCLSNSGIYVSLSLDFEELRGILRPLPHGGKMALPFGWSVRGCLEASIVLFSMCHCLLNILNLRLGKLL